MTTTTASLSERAAYEQRQRAAVTALLRELPVVALSVQQPWAWLIVHGWKDVENRTRRTAHRGPTFIHAARRQDKRGDRFIRHRFPEIPLPPLHALLIGQIVGQASITDCVRPHPSRWYAEGQWAYPLEGAKPMLPIGARGMLGFWTVPEPTRALIARIIAQQAAP